MPQRAFVITDKSKTLPITALVIGTMGVSCGAIFARMADAPALVIAAYRMGFALVLLLPWIGVSTSRASTSIEFRDGMLAALSGVFLAGHFATWISSLNYTTVANSVVLVNTNPIWVGLLTPLITKDRILRETMIGIALCVAGGMLIGWGDLGGPHGALKGDMLALWGSFFAAGYLLIGRLLRQRMPLFAYVGICYAVAAVILGVTAWGFNLPLRGFTHVTWAALIGAAAVSQIVGHTSYNWALKWFSAHMVAISLLGEPILATLMAWGLLGEKPALIHLAGGGLILAGIYMAASRE